MSIVEADDLINQLQSTLSTIEYEFYDLCGEGNNYNFLAAYIANAEKQLDLILKEQKSEVKCRYMVSYLKKSF